MKLTKIEETRRHVTKIVNNTESGVAVETRIVVHNDEGGHVENEYKFELDDGKLTIWNEYNDFIGIYDADAVKVLRDFLNEYVNDEA